jgi:tetratricopeptide (TPR) repeat protein
MAVSPSSITLPERYRLLGHIANGGMASVWEAHDDLLGRDVAVKILAPHLAEDDRARIRFAREARTAAGLSNHPHVVTIYDVGEHDGVSFIVMELLRGGTVADRLKAGRIPRDTALRWLAEAAGALDAAQDAGIVHRDVKPANLLLDERDRLAIADFGIARLALEDQLTATGIVLGTASYIAPEQAEGHEASPASDRYALAVVAYELLTGTKPFQAEHFAAQARMHVEDPPQPPTERDPSLPPAIDDVLLRGLDKQPGRRWPTATAMVAALRTASETPVPWDATTRVVADRTPPRGVPPVAGGPPRSTRTAWLILGALALAAVALALVLSSGDGGEDPSPAAQKTAAPAKKPKAEKTAKPQQQEAAPATTAAPAAGSLDDARALHLQGFAANNAQDYETGLSTSMQALETCGDQQALDPCGYALYEIGRAYVGLGRPAEAIPYLERRLDSYGDNGAGDVSQLLERARGGNASSWGDGNGNGNGNGNGRGRARGGDEDED